MKPFIYTAVLFCITLAATSFVKAQEKIEISTDPPPAAARFPVLREVGTAKVSFFERANQAISESAFIRAYGPSPVYVSVRGRFTSPGKKVVKPESIDLMIYSTSTDRTYVDDRRVKIVLDSKELLNSTGKFKYANTDGHIIMASVVLSIPYTDFVKITEAKQVLMQIGPTAINLNESDITLFRDLLKTIE